MNNMKQDRLYKFFFSYRLEPGKEEESFVKQSKIDWIFWVWKLIHFCRLSRRKYWEDSDSDSTAHRAICLQDIT